MFRFQIDEETELRLLEERHAGELFALTDNNRNYLRRWLPWVDGNKTVEDTKAFIRRALEQFTRGLSFSAGIWWRGRLVGVIGLHRIDQVNHKTEIGYWIGEEYQGKGLVTRACRAIIDYAFSELKLHRVEIHCALGNERSRAIPERLGFRQEGILRQAARLPNRYDDLVIYGILADEWRDESR